MKLIIKSPVWDDLREISQQIACDDRPAAFRFLAACKQTFELLARFPQLGRMRTFSQPGIRSFLVRGFRKYVIFYLPTTTELQVLAVLHGARDVQTVVESRT